MECCVLFFFDLWCCILVVNDVKRTRSFVFRRARDGVAFLSFCFCLCVVCVVCDDVCF